MCRAGRITVRRALRRTMCRPAVRCRRATAMCTARTTTTPAPARNTATTVRCLPARIVCPAGNPAAKLLKTQGGHSWVSARFVYMSGGINEDL